VVIAQGPFAGERVDVVEPGLQAVGHRRLYWSLRRTARPGIDRGPGAASPAIRPAHGRLDCGHPGVISACHDSMIPE
jgi:hypothetical protein